MYSAEVKAQAKEYWKNGWNICDIANQIGANKGTVADWTRAWPSVRASTLADLEVLAGIKRAREDELYRDYGTALEHAQGLVDFCSRQYLAALRAAPGTTLVTAVSGGNPVGLGALELRPEVGWASAVFARRSGEGVGRAVVLNLTKRTEGAGRGRVACEVFEQNAKAQAFFERLGFSKTGAERQSKRYAGARVLELSVPVAELYARMED